MGVSRSPERGLSRREREFMDVIYRRGQATAAEVMDDPPDPPTYSAVRAMLRVLEEKEHVRHEQQGPRYVFLSTVPRDQARRSALKQLSVHRDGVNTAACCRLRPVFPLSSTQVPLRAAHRRLTPCRQSGQPLQKPLAVVI